jgi:hypothetical protein
MTIADIIRSLKNDDHVRMTIEVPVHHVYPDGTVTVRAGADILSFYPDSNFIKSIIKIDRPLKIGELVNTGYHHATILAIAEDYALLKYGDGNVSSAPLKNLKRI